MFTVRLCVIQSSAHNNNHNNTNKREREKLNRTKTMYILLTNILLITFRWLFVRQIYFVKRNVILYILFTRIQLYKALN